MKKILLPLLLLLSLSVVAQKEYYLVVGTYTSGESKGIYVYRFDTKTAEATLVSETETSNPSYIAVSPNQRFIGDDCKRSDIRI